jgi:hypothetical protein
VSPCFLRIVVLNNLKLRRIPSDVQSSQHMKSARTASQTISKKKIQQDATVYQNFIIPYLYEAQHVSGDTPPIIKCWWKVSGTDTVLDNVYQLHVQRPSTYEEPEAASAVLGSR